MAELPRLLIKPSITNRKQKMEAAEDSFTDVTHCTPPAVMSVASPSRKEQGKLERNADVSILCIL
jgi:hypothetical protein